tara:strand:+ start:216 stop:1319 length:1104 start_codon:yes stop_codon:yes gene_type:complete
MITVKELLNILNKNKINFFTGVPDSVLKGLSKSINNLSKYNHVVAVNEGSAVSLGVGYYLSTKKIPCIYLQNSGLGNALNPLISIAHKKVYSIPLLLMIGWRGAPGLKDEPQHMVKGKITTHLLKLLDIEYCILRKKRDLFKLNKLIKKSYKSKKTIACLLEKNTLISEKKIIIKKNDKLPLRKDFILQFLKMIPKKSKIISTTGYTSRELMQIRKEKKLSRGEDFYMVGGMGHASMVAMGYAINSRKQIFCLDGDGSALMHFGSLRTIGHFGNSNLKHVLLNNNLHESVGGQTTTAWGIDFKKIVKSLGYKNYFQILRLHEIKNVIARFINSNGPSFLNVYISNGTLHNLTRPKNLIKIKDKFISN